MKYNINKISILLIGVVLLAVLGCSGASVAATVDSGTCGDNLTWVLTDDGTLTISGTGDMYDYDTIEAPWLKYSSQLTKLSMSDGITTIGKRAFNNGAGWRGFIGSLTIPNSVTTIRWGAFSGCTGFSGSLIIPNSVTSIDKEAFYHCTGFNESLILSNNVTTIGSDAFKYCRNFTGPLVIPSSVTVIGDGAFYECSGFTGSLTIPNNVTAIGHNAFYKCTGFTGSLIIPDSVTLISWEAFSGCSGLTSVSIPKSITSLGEYSFTNLHSNSVIYRYDSAQYDPARFPFNGYYSKDKTAVAFSKINNAYSFTVSDLDFPSGFPLTDENAPIISGREFLGWYENLSFTGDKITTVSCSKTLFAKYPSTVIDSGTCGDSLTWELTDYGVLTISGTGAMYDYSYGTTPWHQYQSQMTKLMLPNGLTTIGSNAFNWCTCLTGTLTIPNSVTTIGDGAFYGCSGFTGPLVLPNSVTMIGGNAFSYCSGFNGNLVIPDSVTTIGGGAFSECSGFTGSLVLPNSVTMIGDSAFYGCSGLTGHLVIPNTVTTIGKSAFHWCSGITGSLIIPNSVTLIGDSAFYGCSNFTGSLTISDNITMISYNAFGGCSNLTGSLLIPNGVTIIGDCAFYGCRGFNGSLVIPDSVTTIGGNAFDGCSGFDGNLVIPDSVTTIGGGAFSECSGLIGSLVIPFGITAIGDYTFFKCGGFTGSLIIPNNVTAIGRNAFNGCCGISNVTIPANVSTIGEYAFTNLHSDSVIYRDDSATSPINSYYSKDKTAVAFSKIHNGYSFTVSDSDFPNGFPLTDENAPKKSGKMFLGWYDNPSLTGEKVTTVFNGQTIYAKYPPTVIDSGTCGNNLIWELTDYGTLTISGTGEMYDYGWESNKAPWYPYRSEMTKLVLSNGITTIGDYAFYECNGFTDSLTIPSTVTSIGDWAFSGCSGFTGSLVIPESVTTIGNVAFGACRGFNGSLVIPSSLTRISDSVFSGCSGFDGSLTISDNITMIGNSAFGGCSNFTGSLIIPNNVGFIGGGAFSGCSSFNGSLAIPDSVYTIGEWAFNECSGLDGFLIISNGVSAIGEYTFRGCSGLTGSLIIPNGVTLIGRNAFSECSGLTGSLVIPDSVTSIGYMAFSGCAGIYNVTIPSSVTSIGSNAFMNLHPNSVIYAECPVTLLSDEKYSKDKSVISGMVSNNAYRFTVPASTFPSGFTLTNENAPSKVGRTFNGWYANPEYTGDKVTTVTNGQTLYAKWHSEVPIIPEIDAFDLNRTSGESPLTVEFTYNIINMTSGTVYLLDGNDVLTQVMYPSSRMVYTFTTPGTYEVHLKAVDEDQNETESDERTITVIPIDDGLHVYPGWNVVSTPKKLSSAYDTAAELFAGVNTTGHAVLTYNAQTKAWEQVTASTKIEPLNAYWIYSNESKILPYEFSSMVSSPSSKSVYKGWNAISLSADEPMSAAETFGNTNWYTYLEWNAASQAFKSALIKGGSGTHADTNLVSLWTGGWLFLNEDGTYMGFTA